MCGWRDVGAGSSARILPNRNLFSQNQHEIASTGKQIVMVGRPEVLCQSLSRFRYRLSFVYQKFLNVSEQNCNAYGHRFEFNLLQNLFALFTVHPSLSVNWEEGITMVENLAAGEACKA